MTSTSAPDLISEIASHGKAFLADSNDDAARQQTIRAAHALIAEFENPGEQMARLVWGDPTRFAATATAFELGLLEKLSTKPLSSKQLAAGTPADPALVSRIMKHLAANDLVKEVGKDQYAATQFSMASSDPTIGGGLLFGFTVMGQVSAKLPAFLKSINYQVPSDANNSPIQYGLGTKHTFFEHLQANPELGTAFNNLMTGYAAMRPRWFDIYPVKERLGTHDPSQGPLLIDVGGGVGHELSGFHAKFHEAPGRLVLQDVSSVIQAAKAASLPSAIEAVVQDFFTPQPEEFCGAGVYFLRQVLHDWTDERCTDILRHLRNAMASGPGQSSRILINEKVVRDVGAPRQQTSLDWTMMALLVSRERTETQWRELLAKSGLKISGIWTEDDESVIEAIIDS